MAGPPIHVPPAPKPKPTKRDELLTEIDRGANTWHKLVEHYESKLALLRAQNDTTKDHDKTEYLRGRIFEIKEFLAFGNPTVINEPEDPIY